jgi:hypothetical protein
MDVTRSIGFKSTGVAKAAFSYGAASMKYKAQFRDPRSPYQLKNASFEVCLVGVTDNGRDVTLVKFPGRKGRRELQMARFACVVWHQRSDRSEERRVTRGVESRRKVYLISSKQQVPEGELILFTIVQDISSMIKANTPASLGGYDFGNHEGP